MDAAGMNARIQGLIERAEEIGKRPAPMRGGSMNDLVELRRLHDLIAERCIEAFKAGLHCETEVKEK